MKYLYNIFLLLFLLNTSCSAQTSATNVLDCKAFSEKIKATPSVQLVDVRTPGECANGMIDGAKNINWNGADFEAQVLALDKQKLVLVYCAKGGRSHAAQAKLLSMGFKDVYDLKGGYSAWIVEVKK